MSNIDPARLAAIFRGLSSTDVQKNRIDKKQMSKLAMGEKSASIDVMPDGTRNKENLKIAIYKRLLALKESDENYGEKAPAVVIREILLWEFGEVMLQHPEFNYFCTTIINQVRGHSELQSYLSNLIENFNQ